MILHKEVILCQVVIARWAISEMTFIDMGKNVIKTTWLDRTILASYFKIFHLMKSALG